MLFIEFIVFLLFDYFDLFVFAKLWICGDAARTTSSTVLVKKLGRTEPDTFGATVHRC